MPLRSYSSLLDVLLGFFCLFPLLLKRKKAPILISEMLLRLAQERLREAQAKNLARIPRC